MLNGSIGLMMNSRWYTRLLTLQSLWLINQSTFNGMLLFWGVFIHHLMESWGKSNTKLMTRNLRWCGLERSVNTTLVFGIESLFIRNSDIRMLILSIWLRIHGHYGQRRSPVKKLELWLRWDIKSLPPLIEIMGAINTPKHADTDRLNTQRSGQRSFK